MDNRRGADNSVVVGAGEQLYNGRVYPCFACYRNCCGADKSHSGAESIALIRLSGREVFGKKTGNRSVNILPDLLIPSMEKVLQ